MTKKQSIIKQIQNFSEAKKLGIFLLMFIAIGGSYMAYRSFALTTKVKFITPCYSFKAPEGVMYGLSTNSGSTAGIDSGCIQKLTHKTEDRQTFFDFDTCELGCDNLVGLNLQNGVEKMKKLIAEDNANNGFQKNAWVIEREKSISLDNKPAYLLVYKNYDLVQKNSPSANRSYIIVDVGSNDSYAAHGLNGIINFALYNYRTPQNLDDVINSWQWQDGTSDLITIK